MCTRPASVLRPRAARPAAQKCAAVWGTAPAAAVCWRPRAPRAAAGAQQPGGGDGDEGEPLWFVKQGLERQRRREEAEAALKQAQAQRQQQQQEQEQQQQDGGQPPAAGAARAPRRPPPPDAARAALRQGLQLAAALGALILAPAFLTPGGLGSPRPWLLYVSYFLFFVNGSVRRVLTHGPLAPAPKDKQRSNLKSTAALAAFIALMPVIHWLPLRRVLLAAAAAPPDSPVHGAAGGVALYDVAGGALVAAAAKLNWDAAAALGAAYDRVVAPEALVTEGPYKLVQHPIYGSYMLLFAGYCLACHSAPFALLAIWACVIYYRRRAALEAGVLRDRFGAEYDAYCARTPKQFVPWVA